MPSICKRSHSLKNLVEATSPCDSQKITRLVSCEPGQTKIDGFGPDFVDTLDTCVCTDIVDFTLFTLLRPYHSLGRTMEGVILSKEMTGFLTRAGTSGDYQEDDSRTIDASCRYVGVDEQTCGPSPPSVGSEVTIASSHALHDTLSPARTQPLGSQEPLLYSLE